MKRSLALVLSAATVLVLGCGTRSYEARLSRTLERMRYRQRLDQNLNAPVEDKLKDLLIFLRPPKPISNVPAKEFMLTAPPTGLFDVEKSFIDGAAKASTPSVRLHVLARRKADRKAAPKKGAPAPEEQAQRGDFKADVLTALAPDFGDAPQSAKFQPYNARKNPFTRAVFATQNNGEGRLFLFKSPPYDVALVWEIPPGAGKTPTAQTGIELSLESFAVGPRAQSQFQGAVGDEEAAAGSAGEGGAAAPF